MYIFWVNTVSAQDIPSPSSSTQSYQTGLDLYEQGFIEEAIQHLQEFSDTHSNHDLRISADYMLARAYTATDSSKIEYYYKAFVLDYPGSDLSEKLLRDLGHRYTEKGDYETAIDYYKQAVDSWMTDKNAAETKYWIAEAAAENEDYTQSRRYFMEVAEEFPRSEWASKALYARGRLYLTEERYDDATEAFEILKDRYPNNEITRRVGTALGEAYYQQERYEEAIEALQGALPYLEDESLNKAVFLIAESQNYLGLYDEASRSYLRYINLTKELPKSELHIMVWDGSITNRRSFTGRRVIWPGR